MSVYFFEMTLGVHTNVKEEKMEKIDIIFDMVQDFISVFEKLISLMRTVEETCIDPFFEWFPQIIMEERRFYMLFITYLIQKSEKLKNPNCSNM